MAESRDEAMERLNRAETDGLRLHEWSRWWQRRGSAQLELILWVAWDPIGHAVPRDEYDGHALGLAKELRQGRGVAEIATWLADAAAGLFGDESTQRAKPTTQDREVAAKVAEWYASEMEREARDRRQPEDE